MYRQIIAITSLSLLISCGGDDDDNNNPTDPTSAETSNPAPLPANQFDGNYTVTAMGTNASDDDGEPCEPFLSGNVTIMNKVINGQVEAENLSFEISGMIDDNNQITAGLAIGDDNLVQYNGTFTDNMASGNYSDSFGCVGTWVFSPIG